MQKLIKQKQDLRADVKLAEHLWLAEKSRRRE